MDVGRQQGKSYQMTFDFEGCAGPLRHDQGGEDGIQPARFEESQTSTASDPARALTNRLMEEVCQAENLNRAYRRVKANKGSAGVDGMTIAQLRSWIAGHRDFFPVGIAAEATVWRVAPGQRVGIPMTVARSAVSGATLLALNFVGEGLREAMDPKRTWR